MTKLQHVKKSEESFKTNKNKKKSKIRLELDFTEANIKKTSLPVQCDWRVSDFMTLFTKKNHPIIISCCFNYLYKKEFDVFFKL